MEVVVTTGADDVQSSSPVVITKPTHNFLQAGSPNHQCQSTEEYIARQFYEKENFLFVFLYKTEVWHYWKYPLSVNSCRVCEGECLFSVHVVCLTLDLCVALAAGRRWNWRSFPFLQRLCSWESSQLMDCCDADNWQWHSLLVYFFRVLNGDFVRVYDT